MIGGPLLAMPVSFLFFQNTDADGRAGKFATALFVVAMLQFLFMAGLLG